MRKAIFILILIAATMTVALSATKTSPASAPRRLPASAPCRTRLPAVPFQSPCAARHKMNVCSVSGKGKQPGTLRSWWASGLEMQLSRHRSLSFPRLVVSLAWAQNQSSSISIRQRSTCHRQNWRPFSPRSAMPPETDCGHVMGSG